MSERPEAVYLDTEASDDALALAPEDAQALLRELSAAFFAGDAARAAAPTSRKPSRIRPGGAVVDEDADDPTELESCVLTIDGSNVIIAHDDAATRIFGQRLVGKPYTSVGLFAELFQRPSRATATRADGTSFPVSIATTVATVPGHRLRIAVVRDLTAAASRAEQRRKAEARYRTLVEQIPAVTFMANLEEGDNEIYIGPQIEALLGYSQEEWLGNPVLWFHTMHPEDQELWNAEFARGIAAGGPFRADCRFFARDGRTVWVHGEARVVRDDDGRPVFIQGVAFDISEIKAAEQKTREAQETLVRTEKLAAVGQLAATVGHELRNPLGAIRGAWLVLEKKLRALPEESNGRVTEFAGIITTELARCSQIIRELLDFSRERPLHRTPCDLAAMIDSAISVVAKPAPAIALTMEVTGELPSINADADQLRQVLVNLAQNAVEAVDEHSGRVVVRASAPAVGAAGVVIEVVDNGKGIPPDVLTRIFEPLFTTKLRGTGLGLALVAGIVRRHGGTIDVTSEPGVGTTFRLALPISEATAGAAPARGGAADWGA